MTTNFGFVLMFCIRYASGVNRAAVVVMVVTALGVLLKDFLTGVAAGLVLHAAVEVGRIRIMVRFTLYAI